MINLKRNKKLELVEAKGIRSRASSIYTPGQTDDFKISRSRFNDFLTCQRCFYLDRVKGFHSPSMPKWTLNETTDILLKKEFDICRAEQTPHRIFIENGLDHLVPFKHPDMDDWRNSLSKGLISRFKETNIILSGGIDDIWQDTKTKDLIVVDYKSQASNYEVRTDYYLASPYHEGYKIQMDFYNYLLTAMGFQVGTLSYFLVVNADRTAEGFHGKMDFSETLVPYQHNISWITAKVEEMITLMNQKKVPESHFSCENCAYSKQRAKVE